MRTQFIRWSVLSAIAALLVGSSVGLANASRAEQSSSQPKKKDTPEKRRPTQAKFSAKVSPARAKPGDEVTYSITAKVEEPWHIYSFAKEQPAVAGPLHTQFDFFDAAGLTPDEDWTSSEEPIRKKEPAFPDLDAVEFHEKSVTWSTTLKVPLDAKPGEKSLKCQIFYQLCDPKSCLPPTRVTVPEAKLTIVTKGSAFRGSALPALPIAQADIPTIMTPAAPAAAGSAEAAIQGGLPAFIAWSALGGVAAVLMPCVWPMIPVTVNFFVKQGQQKKRRSTTLAFVYGTSIVAIFTLVGVLCSILFGGASLVRLASNGWLNLFVAATFLVFGFSLLGLFEIRLPNFLLNASAQGESRGGLIGVVFMALTLTITSFTCTFPVVGGLLVIASKGQYFYPVIGMIVFSSVLALPFFLLALAPGLLSRLPKSGDWMNAVKVVGGLVEIGAAFKFLNTAEIGFGANPSEAWFDAQAVMAIWVAILLVCGIYLLGLFRTDHDHEAVKVGPGRLIFGTIFVGLGLFLAPALFGYPPKSRVYNAIVGLLPPDSGELDSTDRIVHETAERVGMMLPASGLPANPIAVAAAPGAKSTDGAQPPAPVRSVVQGPRKATSKDPRVAVLEEKKFHGVVWGMSFDAAMEEAKATNKPVLIDFTGLNCANCRTAEKSIMPRPDTVAEMRKFVTVAQYTDKVDIDTLDDDAKLDLAGENLDREQELTGQITSPLYTVLMPNGKVLGYTGFDFDPEFLAKFLREMHAKFEAETRTTALRTSNDEIRMTKE